MSKRSRQLSWLVGLAALVVLAVVLARGRAALFGQGPAAGSMSPSLQTASGPSVAMAVGHRAPDFTLTDLSGKTVSLHSYFGKPVLVNFWASWCNPCQKETPELVKLAHTYQGQVAFLGVNITTGDNLSSVKSFVRKYAVPYTIVTDPKGTVGDAYAVSYLPTSVFIDSKGIIRKLQFGIFPSDQALDQAVANLAKGG